MAVFIIIPTAESVRLDQKIAKDFARESLKLPRGEWLVKFDGTTEELSDRLEITDGATGKAIVFAASGYFGYAPTNIWEWLKSRWS